MILPRPDNFKASDGAHNRCRDGETSTATFERRNWQMKKYNQTVKEGFSLALGTIIVILVIIPPGPRTAAGAGAEARGLAPRTR
jgi:hypothetical protein